MMLKFREEIKIYVNMQPIDARKSIDGLCALVLNNFAENPQGGNVFIFFNKAKDKVKIFGGMRTVLHFITNAWRSIVLFYQDNTSKPSKLRRHNCMDCSLASTFL